MHLEQILTVFQHRFQFYEIMNIYYLIPHASGPTSMTCAFCDSQGYIVLYAARRLDVGTNNREALTFSGERLNNSTSLESIATGNSVVWLLRKCGLSRSIDFSSLRVSSYAKKQV